MLGSAHTAPKEFVNRGFTLKTHQMFSVHATSEEFENTAITGYFRFVFEGNSGMKSHNYREVNVSEKLLFQNVFRPR